MPVPLDDEYDLIIVGAGPVGLTLANLIGPAGSSILVIEKLDSLIDYPRGVGMDDECLRVFQAMGLADQAVQHTTPHQWMDFRTAKGRSFALIRPQTDHFGWPKRNAFIQPLIDRVLLGGLQRYSNVRVEFGTEFIHLSQTSTDVSLTIKDQAGQVRTVTCSYLIGADGGRSPVRKAVGIGFQGETESTRWLVVDLEEDPVGTPNAVLMCDPARPYVSIALPHGIRRLEFMVMGGETEEELTSTTGLSHLLSRVLPNPAAARIIRSRVYTHHARLADSFQAGRVLLAGDAAHLMPVWQGQGYNSGIRDANNLAWKLVEVLRGNCGPALLETYTQERRTHAKAMIQLSTTVGRIFSPTSHFLAKFRDIAFSLLNRIPPVRDYVVQMRFKPMPRYQEGVVIRSQDRQSDGGVGQLFIQPKVRHSKGEVVRLDDVVGSNFTIISWATNPWTYMSDSARLLWKRLGGKILVVRPDTELNFSAGAIGEEAILVGDFSHSLKDWFSTAKGSVVILRPDRFVAASCGPQETSKAIEELGTIMHMLPVSATSEALADEPARRGRTRVGEVPRTEERLPSAV